MSAPAGESFKGLGKPEEEFDGQHLRILIVHARQVYSSSYRIETDSNCRWNTPVIDPLVQGCIETMLKSGVKRDNIVVETVPGSYELPMACAR